MRIFINLDNVHVDTEYENCTFFIEDFSIKVQIKGLCTTYTLLNFDDFAMMSINTRGVSTDLINECCVLILSEINQFFTSYEFRKSWNERLKPELRTDIKNFLTIDIYYIIDTIESRFGELLKYNHTRHQFEYIELTKAKEGE